MEPRHAQGAGAAQPDVCYRLMYYSVKKAPVQRTSFMGAGGGVKETAAPDFGEDVSPEVHPLFATGETVFWGDFSQLWVSSFDTPGILEIAELRLVAGCASAQVCTPFTRA